MTSRPPTRRLVDVLRQNRPETLQRHATDLAAAASSLHAEAIQTRFLRNQFLINPKALCLLSNEDLLTRWHVFGLYKPPFCPMRKSAAQDNYHHVSVESFVEAALRSKSIYPTLRRVLSPSEVQVRVLHNLDSFASGPVLVALSNHFQFATSLATTTMEYDVLVSGHLPVHATGNQTAIPTAHLFPSAASLEGGKQEAAATTTTTTTTQAHYQVKENGYYSVHPVSLLNVVIKAPPTSQPPTLERFVREQLGSSVLGDPLVMGELMQLQAYDQAAQKRQSGKAEESNTTASSDVGDKGKKTASDAAAHAAAVKLAANPHIVSMRGDCDFPRVFMHLREVRVDTSNEKPFTSSAGHGGAEAAGGQEASGMAFNFPLGGPSPSSFSAHQQQQQGQQFADFSQKLGIELHCRKCFDGLVQKHLSASVKARRIGLLDGTWTPQAEFL